MSQGFVQTGRFESVGAVELDPQAAATYRANFGDHMFNGDITDWLRRGNLPAADVVIGVIDDRGRMGHDYLAGLVVVWND